MENITKSKQMVQLEKTLEEYFGKKAPQMPEGLKEFLVKIAPYLVILGLLVSIPSLLAVLGIGGFASMFAPYAMRAGSGYWLSIVMIIPVIILQVLGVPGLFARSLQGWRYMYLASLVSVVVSVLQLNILGAIIGGAINLYVLFQVKGKYK